MENSLPLAYINTTNIECFDVNRYENGSSRSWGTMSTSSSVSTPALIPISSQHELAHRKQPSISSNGLSQPALLDMATHQNTTSSESFEFKGKAKFRNEEPTLVGKRDFELVHKALSLQQQNSNDLNKDNSSFDVSTTSDFMSSVSSLGSVTASVTSDFIAWLDTPLASAPSASPPVLTFAKDLKGQPVTVVFYHGLNTVSKPPMDSISSNSDPVNFLPSSSSSALTSSPASRVLCTTDRTYIEDVPTSKVTLKFSAGVCLVRSRLIEGVSTPEVLVIRRQMHKFYELPKGHLEKGESLIQAAARELVEETGIKTQIEIGTPLLSERYVVKRSTTERIEKSVHYFRAFFKNASDANDAVIFGDREEQTRELKWMSLEEARTALWKSNAVRSVVLAALTDENEI